MEASCDHRRRALIFTCHPVTTLAALFAGTLLPAPAAKALLEAGLSFGKTLAGPAAGPVVARWRQAQLQSIFSSGDTLRLQFPREDLGFRYRHGAVVQHSDAAGLGSAAAVAAAAGSGVGGEAHGRGMRGGDAGAGALGPGWDDFEDMAAHDWVWGGGGRGAGYVPSCEPGCRLPHLWLAPVVGSPQASVGPGGHGAAEAAGTAGRAASHGRCGGSGSAHESSSTAAADAWVSTLDLAALGRGGLVLLLPSGGGGGAPGGGAGAWLNAAAMLPRSLATVVIVTAAAPSSSAGGAEHAAQQTAGNEAAVVAAAHAAGAWCFTDVEQRWASVGVPPGSALLLRPDGHVAWRHLGPPPSKDIGAASLAAAQAHVLALS